MADANRAGWLTEPAPAKVNLFLHVVGRRPDGYHELDSLAVFPGPGDVLHAAPADALSLEVVGPFAAGLATEGDNLVLRAARALAPGRGARLVLEKRLPVASGIGGGSADAAAALRVLSRLWGVAADLPGIAATLGADVPVCLGSTPTRMGGIGDVLTASPGLPECDILLVNPGVGVGTPEVFRRRHPGLRPPADLPSRWAAVPDLIHDLHGTTNDLQEAAETIEPSIREVIRWLNTQPGCLLSRMSGSGATCFGLFDRTPPVVPDGWWGAAGHLRPPPTPSHQAV